MPLGGQAARPGPLQRLCLRKSADAALSPPRLGAPGGPGHRAREPQRAAALCPRGLPAAGGFRVRCPEGGAGSLDGLLSSPCRPAAGRRAGLSADSPTGASPRTCGGLVHRRETEAQGAQLLRGGPSGCPGVGLRDCPRVCVWGGASASAHKRFAVVKHTQHAMCRVTVSACSEHSPWCAARTLPERPSPPDRTPRAPRVHTLPLESPVWDLMSVGPHSVGTLQRGDPDTGPFHLLVLRLLPGGGRWPNLAAFEPMPCTWPCSEGPLVCPGPSAAPALGRSRAALL